MGKLVFSVLAAIAEFKRELIRERVVAGMKEAKRKGKHCGRPQISFDLETA
jgi:DNA invertase Pin-like site-specific DNA recombinase